MSEDPLKSKRMEILQKIKELLADEGVDESFRTNMAAHTVNALRLAQYMYEEHKKERDADGKELFLEVASHLFNADFNKLVFEKVFGIQTRPKPDNMMYA